MEIKKIMQENSVENVFDVTQQDWMDDAAKKCNTDCQYWSGSGAYNNYGCVYLVDGKGNQYF